MPPFLGLCDQPSSAKRADACDGLKGVDRLLIAKAVVHLTTWGSAATAQSPLGHTDLDACLAGRLVVLTEGCELLSSRQG